VLLFYSFTFGGVVVVVVVVDVEVEVDVEVLDVEVLVVVKAWLVVVVSNDVISSKVVSGRPVIECVRDSDVCGISGVVISTFRISSRVSFELAYVVPRIIV
jgi:hypothetical protein